MTRTSPSISVIIPAYNEEKLIVRCIDSVIHQSYQNFEIIVICNGCTDRTYQVVRAINDGRVRAIKIKPANVSLARNTGAEKARGEILVFLDADSIIAKNLLERISYYVSLGYVGGTTKTTSIENAVAPKVAWWIGNISKQFFLTASGIMFCRRDVFPGFDVSLRIGEDTYFLLALKKKGKLAYITESFIKTSSRRWQKEGILRTTFKVCKGFFLRKNYEYNPVR
ncbi:MAG: glycosyltransferase family A protein [Candidatus Woesearchaeota archaeon]